MSNEQCTIKNGCPICGLIGWLFRNPYVALLARVFIGLIFIYASLDKIDKPPQFARSVLNYEFFPVWTVNLIAIIVPWLELIVGTLLVIGLFTMASNTIVFGMLIFFFVLIASALARGLEIDCGCFAASLEGQVMDWTYLLRDIGFILCSLVVYTMRKQILALDSLRRKRS